MKKWYVLLLAFTLMMPCVLAFAGEKKKKEKEKSERSDSLKKQGAYHKIVKKAGCQTAKGKFITVHKVGGKIYFEYPLVNMNREMLIASTPSESSEPNVCQVGYKGNDPLHVKFTLKDSLVFLCEVNSVVSYDEKDKNLTSAVKKSFMDPLMKKYPVEAYTPDSTAVVFEVTSLFMGNEPELSPIIKKLSFLSVTSTLRSELSTIGAIKSFDDNVTIESSMSYSYALRFMIFSLGGGDVSTKVVRTLLLLPEEKMKPRISDSRVGIFLTMKKRISTEQDKILYYTLANRWRLDPMDKKAWERGELVEPVKPIVYYVDNAFPELWKQPIKEGVLRWNQAFEKIGFKNAVQVRDFPSNDPEFDPDNLKYSCIRYVPLGIANAMGPSWVDPTTGEIVNASVIVYNDIIKLINNWRFVQTAQVDPRVRNKKMPDDIVKESVAYVVAHEVGHTLGLMHNMAASNAFPVDSLRSAAFTRKYGTTPSIMDYARFNYVAQPGDQGVNLTPPDLGCYDEFAIRWLYSQIPGNLTERQEAKILETWVDEKAGDPRYRYGKQQVMSRYDPTALEEDLGDDPLKAGEYGIRNLKYILSNLNDWITDDGSAEHREDLYDNLAEQYARYLYNVMHNVGGVYLTEVKDGTSGNRFQSVPKEVQRASLKWTIKQLQHSAWLDDKSVSRKMGFGLNRSSELVKGLSEALLDLQNPVQVSAQVSDDPYTIQDFYNDLYVGIWQNPISGRTLTEGEKALQRMMAKKLTTAVNKMMDKKSFVGVSSSRFAYVPSLDEICSYGLDPSGMVTRYYDALKKIEAEQGRDYVADGLSTGFNYGYGWQRIVDIESIDESESGYMILLDKVRNLLENNLRTVNSADKAHYQAILFKLKSLGK